MQGACKVLVEQKSGDEAFGKGRKVHMTFGEFVQQLEQGNDSLYLTTQEVGESQGQSLLSCSLCMLYATAKTSVCGDFKLFITHEVLTCGLLLQCIANATIFLSPSI